MDVEWHDLLGAALGGGVTVKALDILYQEIRRSDTARSARRFVDEHLDPLLKAADELVGKLRALADQDFNTIRELKPDAERSRRWPARSRTRRNWSRARR